MRLDHITTIKNSLDHDCAYVSFNKDLNAYLTFRSSIIAAVFTKESCITVTDRMSSASDELTCSADEAAKLTTDYLLANKVRSVRVNYHELPHSYYTAFTVAGIEVTHENSPSFLNDVDIDLYELNILCASLAINATRETITIGSPAREIVRQFKKHASEYGASDSFIAVESSKIRTSPLSCPLSLVQLDCGVQKHGLWSDFTTHFCPTAFREEITEIFSRLTQVNEAIAKAFVSGKPSEVIQTIDQAKILSKGIGHVISYSIHLEPSLTVNTSDGIDQCVFCVEPLIDTRVGPIRVERMYSIYKGQFSCLTKEIPTIQWL